jgi:transposase
MSGVSKIQIAESPETLQKRMKQQKTVLNFAKVQALYLLKIQMVDTVRALAVIVGKNEATVHRWLRLYREEGLEALLEEKKSPGRPPKIDKETKEKIQQELSDPEGFSSYKEIQLWLRAVHGIFINYKTLYHTLRREWQTKMKVPRPTNCRQEAGAIEKFREKLPQRLQNLKYELSQWLGKYEKIRYWCGDESRFGLQTIPGKKITMKGIKPWGYEQWKFKYFYVYGLVEPLTGDSFFYELSHLDTLCWEIFLWKFAQQYPNDLHILQVDRAPSHTCGELQLPENVILLFQPSYCPQVNPIERLWEFIKSFLKWENFIDLDSLRKRVKEILDRLSQEIISSLTGWDFILNALSIAKF